MCEVPQDMQEDKLTFREFMIYQRSTGAMLKEVRYSSCILKSLAEMF